MNSVPQTLADLKSAIAEQHSALSKRLRQVAQYVMDNPNAIAFGTVAVIAKDASVHPSTLVRFANAFGFSGFSEMQRLFQQKLIQESPSYTERIRIAREELGDESGDTPLQLLTQFAGASAVALEQLRDSVSEQDLERAVDILAAAEATHVVGVRRAFVVATYFAYALRHIDRRAYLIDGVGGMYAEQGGAIGSKDAIIATSFHPYAPETQDVAKAAVERGVPLILITDSQLSPLAALASVCFVVRDAEVHGFRALGSTLCLAQALSISLAYRVDKQRVAG
ncbi:MurR/RpiR family transcriptional regulator [Marinobacterium rhizophilum]|uniref:MurR/RpiR family transcriptional regulator n=1 Tax=Marinobacterium rhizophilum TaxID=420402 RepID=A0ABY5HNE5_9GAMM|nr:MurR/RpiR family transcriptional regulator [Marinobacterium rhizophilum]UTW12725.1 MurR/RpiR family transcriptional regulator [Marinobacterium rhizophilum]